MISNRLPSLLVCAFLAAPLFAGNIHTRTAYYIHHLTTPNSQTFTLSTQVFTGSTDCSSGGGSINTINGVDFATGHTIDVAAGDSVILTVDPGSSFPQSDQDGSFVNFGAEVALSGTFINLPGDAKQICVMGFNGPETREYPAFFYNGIELLDPCGNRRMTWAPGETINFKVSGGLTFNPEPLRFAVAGGSVNECTWFPPAATVHVTSDPWFQSFTLPSSNAEISPGCASGGTTSILGSWRVVTIDSSCGCLRSQINFTVAADAPPPAPCSITCPDDITVSNDEGECGATVTYATPAGATCSHPSGSFFPAGTTNVSCTAGALSCDFDVTVTDDEAPVMSAVTASPSSLWPPNHKMVDVALTYSATDNCASPSCTIVSVTSNEPDNGLGDGDTAGDWQIVDATHVRLRAERSGKDSGRVYTITVQCGSETKSVQVTVPKNR